MKKITLSLLSLFVLILVSCKESGIEEPELPPLGGGSSDIRPEKNEVYFGAKGDTMVVNTENPYTNLFLFDHKGDWLQPRNKTKDTIAHTWAKIIALDFQIFLHEDKIDFSISSKKVKIIVFDNNTGEERKRNMLLGRGNSGANIKIVQSK